MKRIFLGFRIFRFGIGPLHYVSSCSDFSFKFLEIFVIKKRLPHSLSWGVDKIACRYNFFKPLNKSMGVSDSLTRRARRLGESPTRQVRESFFDYEYLPEFEAKIEPLER
jgi:hypothetical protein